MSGLSSKGVSSELVCISPILLGMFGVCRRRMKVESSLFFSVASAEKLKCCS